MGIARAETSTTVVGDNDVFTFQPSSAIVSTSHGAELTDTRLEAQLELMAHMIPERSRMRSHVTVAETETLRS